MAACRTGPRTPPGAPHAAHTHPAGMPQPQAGPPGRTGHPEAAEHRPPAPARARSSRRQARAPPPPPSAPVQSQNLRCHLHRGQGGAGSNDHGLAPTAPAREARTAPAAAAPQGRVPRRRVPRWAQARGRMGRLQGARRAAARAHAAEAVQRAAARRGRSGRRGGAGAMRRDVRPSRQSWGRGPARARENVARGSARGRARRSARGCARGPGRSRGRRGRRAPTRCCEAGCARGAAGCARARAARRGPTRRRARGEAARKAKTRQLRLKRDRHDAGSHLASGRPGAAVALAVALRVRSRRRPVARGRVAGRRLRGARAASAHGSRLPSRRAATHPRAARARHGDAPPVAQLGAVQARDGQVDLTLALCAKPSAPCQDSEVVAPRERPALPQRLRTSKVTKP